MRPLLSALLLLVTTAASAQPGLQAQERLSSGFLRSGYRVGDDTSQARLDVTVRVGDVAVQRLVRYPAENDTLGEPTRTFRVTRGTQEVMLWTDPYSGAWEEGFDVLVGDLDGDRTREVLVVHHVGTGNGLGVATWEVNVLPETGAAPMRFLTVDYGPDGLVIRRPGGLRLNAAQWEEGREPGRGGGLYYTARLYRYTAGHLVPEGPVLQRRYLYSFQNLRGREAEAGRYHPERWITRNTLRVARDPGVPGGRRQASEPVTALASVPGEGTRLRWADGREQVVPVGLFGDAATGRLFPEGYVPLGTPEGWVVGRGLRLDTYASPYAPDEQVYVLWVAR